MIIKATRLRTVYGSKQTRNHICRGEDNLEVRVIQGSESWIDETFSYAASHGREYAVRHLIIAPEVDTSIEQMIEVARRYAAEFGLDFEDAFVVAHHKTRVREDACKWHLHVLFPDYDILTGAASDNRNNFQRQEKLAREAEHRLGHPFVHGAHTRWVVRQLIKEDKVDIATALQAAFPDDAPRPKASLHQATIQRLKRQGLSASALRQHVREAWHGTATADEFLARVAACGMSIIAGERDPPSWIVTVNNGGFLCSLAGALPGVRIITINERLGDPANDRKADINPPVAGGRADPAYAAPDPRTSATAGAGRDRSDRHDGARADDDRSIEANRAGPGDPARAAGNHNRLHDGSPGLEVGARGFAPQDLAALYLNKRAIADVLVIARRAAELPYERVTRILDQMEGMAFADQISANVPVTPSHAEAQNKLRELTDVRAKTSQSLRDREAELKKLRDQLPSWRERVTGSHAAKIKHAEAECDHAKAAADDARACEKKQTEWTGLLTAAHERRVAAAVPTAENAARNIRVVEKARHMLTTDPRLASIGPFAFIAEAARRASSRRAPHYGSADKTDSPLPSGEDARMVVNRWGIPLKFG